MQALGWATAAADGLVLSGSARVKQSCGLDPVIGVGVHCAVGYALRGSPLDFGSQERACDRSTKGDMPQAGDQF